MPSVGPVQVPKFQDTIDMTPHVFCDLFEQLKIGFPCVCARILFFIVDDPFRECQRLTAS